MAAADPTRHQATSGEVVSLHVHAEGQVPVDIGRFEVGTEADASVRTVKIDEAEAFLYGVDSSHHFFRTIDIAGNGHGRIGPQPVQLLSDLVRASRVAVEHGYCLSTVGMKSPGHRPTDTACTAGDHHDLAGNFHARTVDDGWPGRFAPVKSDERTRIGRMSPARIGLRADTICNTEFPTT